ncbi:uncharacterized protein K460DRAFT_410479 [Cucurbitaria berberidis CBS 394.84]|uniref:Uncharacterized protein n=1 Tax=Cucurbitaria berberidis CBS 394.84 TaxID=1168544 RepID=A0A9P4L498_9PLEO|nr:uncharacterized protein K460DRAFT_410479 [Cucurbitaria berberidis CBS 394.84]KAF1841087.1 hypothetical protein K460DRAFT_410479 [Cucurbitaria berberidis CBS 394.84]
MLLNIILTTLLSALPSTLSAPTSDFNYQCGYVFTKPNANVHAGLSAFNSCTDFFYNSTISDYQDAYAYKLFGGCKCGFYVGWEECVSKVGGPFQEGPTRGEYWEVVNFAEPKPKWYNCFQV